MRRRAAARVVVSSYFYQLRESWTSILPHALRTATLLHVGTAVLLVGACYHPRPASPTDAPGGARSSTLALAQPNDNRQPAGGLRDGVLTVELDVVAAGWRPDLGVDSAVTLYAFAERGGVPQVPGPLLRVPAGTDVHMSVRNRADSTLFFQARTTHVDTLDVVRIAPGETQEVRWRATDAGTYRYRARTNLSPSGVGVFSGRDAQLTGAIVVDPPNTRPEPGERIFVITLIDIVPDSAKGISDDVWEIAINGRSWPYTERLHYGVGDTARWRWINASDRIHPMHLHGFHFRVLSKGDGRVDTTYSSPRYAVTEAMLAGTTFTMDWVPTRAGNWLMHCHMMGHITPFPARSDTARGHDFHDVVRHAEQSMAGLVLGITTSGERRDDPALRRGGTHHRLFVQESAGDSTRGLRKGYVLQRGAEPASDSVEVPGSMLVARRGHTTTVTIINRLSQPTSVHWHGIEIESVFDGVPGFSGYAARVAPLIAPGDSFTVSFTPPRAGTYMYHTHMDEEDQFSAGLYAPLLVLNPGETLEEGRDVVLTVGHLLGPDGKPLAAVNGQAQPEPVSVRAGVPHRLRLINLLANPPLRIAFVNGDSTLHWRIISKDGADLPEPFARSRPARIVRVGVGEAYDFEWVPAAGEQPMLVLEVLGAGAVVAATIRQRFIVDR